MPVQPVQPDIPIASYDEERADYQPGKRLLSCNQAQLIAASSFIHRQDDLTYLSENILRRTSRLLAVLLAALLAATTSKPGY